ncbi:MAG: alpha/beta fold hydrolase [Acidobacteriaceae bacterium]
MATTTIPTVKRGRLALRAVLLGMLTLAVALVVVTILRPLGVLWVATQLRLRVDGIHSEFTEIPFGHVGKVRVHYYVGGSGAPILLVHGLGSRAEDWANLMPSLVRDHHRVYALDLPGYGQSDWPANAQYSIPELTGAVEAFMNDQHLTRIDLAGWSMGGWIAMRVALDEPQRIRRLMVFDSAGLTFAVNWNKNLFEPDTPEKLSTMMALLMPSPPHVPGFVEHAIFRFVARHGWVVRRNLDSMLTGDGLLDGQLGALKMPVLIVWGKQDHLIPLSVGEAMHHEIPQSELEIFDGCGHLAPNQCAGRVAPVVNGFLDEVSPMPGRQGEIPH